MGRHFPTDDTARLIIRVIVFHFLKQIAREGQPVLLAAEVLDYSFTSAISGRGHMERTSLLFTAVESHLRVRASPSSFIALKVIPISLLR